MARVPMTMRTDIDDDDDRIVPDGTVLRVPLFMCDAVQRAVAGDLSLHQPGFRTVSDAANTARDAAREARSAWIKQMCDAWKHPRTCDAAEPDTNRERTSGVRDARAAAEGEYAAMCERL